jgi:hypothetical protein
MSYQTATRSNIFTDPNLPRFSQQILGKNGTRQKDFISLDLRADYKWQVKQASWTAFMDVVDINNRFNQSSAIFQPLTGRVFHLGLAVFPTFGLRIDGSQLLKLHVTNSPGKLSNVGYGH